MKIPQIFVISLARSTARQDLFGERNDSVGFDYQFFDGIDGCELWDVLKKSSRVARAWSDGWGKGAIGAGLSHMMLWKKCIELDAPIIVLEDDVFVSDNFLNVLECLPSVEMSTHDFILFGWNFDSVLKAELLPGIEFISLFNPAFPDSSVIRSLFSSADEKKLCVLRKALGLPGYLLTPSGATKLLNGIPRFVAEPLCVGRGIPQVPCLTLDAQMNRLYPEMRSYVMVPPVVIAENDKSRSQTSPRDFG